jgi:hypothetical protein
VEGETDKVQARSFRKEGWPVSQSEAIFAIVLGSSVIVVSFFIDNFYGARGMPVAIASDQKVPRWQGRLGLCVIGGLMILTGLVYFFPNH